MRKLTIATGALLLSLGLAACGGAAPTTTAPTTGALDATAVPTTGALDATAVPTTGALDATAVPSTGDVSGTATASGETIADLVANDSRFTVLRTALQATNLDETLAQSGPYTVFAPTDEAFAAIPEPTLQQLLAEPAQLRTILAYHVAQGEVTASDLATTPSVTTVEGEEITATVSGSDVTLNDTARVVSPDIEAGNGVVHVIDQVLIPPTITLP